MMGCRRRPTHGACLLTFVRGGVGITSLVQNETFSEIAPDVCGSPSAQQLNTSRRRIHLTTHHKAEMFLKQPRRREDHPHALRRASQRPMLSFQGVPGPR